MVTLTVTNVILLTVIISLWHASHNIVYCKNFVYKFVSNAAVTCPTLISPSNGTVLYVSRDYRSVATYTCNSGFEVIGSPTRTCQFNEMWSESEPTCERTYIIISMHFGS